MSNILNKLRNLFKMLSFVSLIHRLFKCCRRLITVNPEVWNIPTIQKFVPLLDNYERDTLVNEHVTPQVISLFIIFYLKNCVGTKGKHLVTFKLIYGPPNSGPLQFNAQGT